MNEVYVMYDIFIANVNTEETIYSVCKVNPPLVSRNPK